MTGRDRRLDDQLRAHAPQVLAAVVRRYGHFDIAEDAVQEALIAAARQWPLEGVPDSPRGWLITVASRRLTDLLRGELARRRREQLVVERSLPEEWWAPAADLPTAGEDDSLILLLMCCHSSLSVPSQIALTLRAVGGLTTAEIARAFLVPEATMTRRITRAKQTIADISVPFRLPTATEIDARLAATLHVLYLVFTEGYAATTGAAPERAALADEAIRLTRLARRMLPDDSEIQGLLALMLLTNARRAARVDPDGALVPMQEQDRTRWDAGAIAEGIALVEHALPRGPVGPYQLQAAIAALHDEADSPERTDWAQIVALYELLLRAADNPVVRLNHAVAVGMARGADAGLLLVDGLSADRRLVRDHRLHAVRAHLLERSGDAASARDSFLRAAGLTTSVPQQRYLYAQAERLAIS